MLPPKGCSIFCKMKNTMLKLLVFTLLIQAAACRKKEVMEEPAGLPAISVNHISQLEGNEPTFFDFKIRLSKTSTKSVSLNYATQDLSATAGEDYQATSGMLIFDPGVTELTLSVGIVGDTLREEDEKFRLLLSNPKNALLVDSFAMATILNDDTFLPGGGDQGYSTPESYPGYTLVWQDEFNGIAIDPANWKHELGAGGWGNNESQFYTANPENSFISDGKLVIEARKEDYNGSPYTSARMITAGLREFKYGRVDIRAKLPQGKGIWPALWMLGSNIWTVSWPKCGEIDIMEVIGSEPSTLHGTAHWEHNGNHASYSKSTKLNEGKFADKYHVFSLVWDENFIRWLLDDVEYNVIDIRPAGLSEFHQPYFFIFNVAVGGNWPGYPDAATAFPQRMFVDYIRMFQQ